MNLINSDQTAAYGEIMIQVGPKYYGDPSHQQVVEISKCKGYERQYGIYLVALEILEKANAEPARVAYLKKELEYLKQVIKNEQLLNSNLYQKYTETLDIGIKKVNKTNRYLLAFVHEASNGKVTTHQMVSAYQVRLICTVCNASFTYDEDSESDWVMSEVTNFCHDHRHEKRQLIVIDVPIVESNRRKFRDE